MSRTLRRSTLLLAITLLIGCQQFQNHAQPKATGHVYHVVLCWLKEPGNETARQKLIDTSKTFTQIPGVVEVSAGRPIPSTRPVVDSSYDVAIVMRFTDRQALESYAKHPVHVAARENVLNPLVTK